MKLYVCYGTFKSPRPGGHPCGNAYRALKEAGHEPEVIKSYGLGLLPDAFNNTKGRKKARELTGSGWMIERPFQRMRFGHAAASPAELPFAVAGPEYG
jgi:hypothetical protein